VAIFSSFCQKSATCQEAPASGSTPAGVRITGGVTTISPICTATTSGRAGG
jgi:hypothetical protein